MANQCMSRITYQDDKPQVCVRVDVAVKPVINRMYLVGVVALNTPLSLVITSTILAAYYTYNALDWFS